MPYSTPFPLQNVAFTAAPAGWTGILGYYDLVWQTDFLGDQLFARLNLPRPIAPEGLRQQLTPGVRAMSVAQRETAIAAVVAHAAALSEVRALLEGE